MLAWIPYILFSCEETPEDPNQFNAQEESLTILVGISSLEDDQTRSLNSTTGVVEVATAQISPGGGPSGTIHQIQVEILEEYEEKIQEVRVDINSGDRGNLQYTLINDSAQSNLYVLELESIAQEGEEREDIFTFSLWDLSTQEEGSQTEEDTEELSLWQP